MSFFTGYITDIRYFCKKRYMFPLFFAKKIYKSFNGKNKVSSLAVKLSVTGVAIGITVIILSLAIILGFKGEIKQKIYGFNSDLRITSLEYGTSYETASIKFSDSIMNCLKNTDGVKHIQRYSTKPGMIKTKDNFQGVILKGVGQEYDYEYIKSTIIEGTLPSYNDSTSSNDIILSKNIADKMKIKLNDNIYIYFIGKNIQVRKLKVCAIYQTNINEYDKIFILSDIKLINGLERWKGNMASGLEIKTLSNDYRNKITDKILEISEMPDYENWTALTPEEIHPDIFSWLDILDTNVLVILLLMFGLAFFSIISGLLIIILERVNTIGILKALGATNKMIKRTFITIASMIVIKGLIWGNIIALTIYAIQTKMHLIKLDASVYYIDYVPMNINPLHLVIINIATLVLSIIILVVPSIIISRISPTKTIKFD